MVLLPKTTPSCGPITLSFGCLMVCTTRALVQHHIPHFTYIVILCFVIRCLIAFPGDAELWRYSIEQNKWQHVALGEHKPGTYSGSNMWPGARYESHFSSLIPIRHTFLIPSLLLRPFDTSHTLFRTHVTGTFDGTYYWMFGGYSFRSDPGTISFILYIF